MERERPEPARPRWPVTPDEGGPRTSDVAGWLRLLIENADHRVRRERHELFRMHGFEVASCGGPRRLDDGCPLAEGRGCPLVDDADVVLFDLDLDRDDEVAVFDALRATRPALPVVIEVPFWMARRHRRRLDGCKVIPPFDAGRLLRGATGEARDPRR